MTVLRVLLQLLHQRPQLLQLVLLGRVHLEGEAEIHYFTKKEFAPILASNPNIDKLRLFGENLSLALDEIEKIPSDKKFSRRWQSRIRIFKISTRNSGWINMMDKEHALES